jgi:inosose dehydratase
MKLAYSGNIQSADELPVMVARFRSLGYEGLQLKGGQWGTYLSDPVRFMAEIGSVPGAASAFITYGNLDEANQVQIRSAIRAANHVGTERVIFCLYGPREGLADGGYDHYARLLTELGRDARAHGLWLSIHNHMNSPFMVPEDFRQILGRIGPGVIELTIDTAHLGLAGVSDIAAVFREFHPFIGNIHMKDLQNGEFKVLGEGDIAFRPIFKAIHDVGYDGWMSADEESGAELIRGMTACHAFMVKGLSAPSLQSAVELTMGRTADHANKH